MAKLVIPWGFHYVGRLMTMTRGALVPLIYSKLLQLRGNDLHQMTAFTLMSADVETIVNDSWRLLEPWAHLLQIVIGTYLLYRQLGAVCCIPIVVILCKSRRLLAYVSNTQIVGLLTVSFH